MVLIDGDYLLDSTENPMAFKPGDECRASAVDSACQEGLKTIVFEPG